MKKQEFVSITDVSPADTARDTETKVQPIQHIGANGSATPSGATASDPIHVSTGGVIASEVGDGRQVVASKGTAEALATSTAIKEVTVTAETDNTEIVCVGGSTVIAALATRRGNPLFPGDSITIASDNLAEVFVDSLVDGEGVTYSYLL